MDTKRYQFRVTGPAGSACFETDNPDILRKVGEALRDPSVGKAMFPEVAKAGRPRKPVYVIAKDDLFSPMLVGAEFPDAFEAAKVLGVAPLTIRQALYVARQRDENFAKVKGVVFSYNKAEAAPDADESRLKKSIIVLEVDGSPLISLRAFDQFPSVVEAAEVFGVLPRVISQALYQSRLAGKKQAKVRGVLLSYVEDYAETVRD